MSASVLTIVVKPSLLFLDCVLAGVSRQSSRDFEVLFIADNAQPDAIRYLESSIPSLPVPTRVVWSGDALGTDTAERGALRTALRVSTADAIVVSDSVSILHPRFMEMHGRHHVRSTIITGPRVELSPEISSELDKKDILDGWPAGRMTALVADGVFGRTTNVSHAFFLPSPRLQSASAAVARDVHASNFSLCRHDAERLLRFLDSESAPDARSLKSKLGMRILSYRNTFVQYRCNEPGSVSLLRVPGVLQRVQHLRLSVPELGLRPAMHSSPRALQPYRSPRNAVTLL
ncbi:MAG: hypothetical protein ACKOB6_08895 [Candidatus Kapaibacterium sp.]